MFPFVPLDLRKNLEVLRDPLVVLSGLHGLHLRNIMVLSGLLHHLKTLNHQVSFRFCLRSSQSLWNPLAVWPPAFLHPAAYDPVQGLLRRQLALVLLRNLPTGLLHRTHLTKTYQPPMMTHLFGGVAHSYLPDILTQILTRHPGSPHILQALLRSPPFPLMVRQTAITPGTLPLLLVRIHPILLLRPSSLTSRTPLPQ